jgi:hypothetical protein
MRLIIVILFAVLFTLPGYGQISTIVIKNNLVIPENPQEEIIKISKKELSNVEFITSKLGEVTGYSIYFKMDKTNLYIKTLEVNSFELSIKNHLLAVDAGTHFMLENVTIKMPNKKGMVSMNYEFILED